MEVNYRLIDQGRINARELMKASPLMSRTFKRRLNGAKMLWLEDDKRERGIIATRERFKRWNLDVTIEDRSDAALARFFKGAYDLVLVDLLMKKERRERKSGVTFIEAIRNKNEDVPIFVYSAYLHDKEFQTALDQIPKIMGCIEKPLPSEPDNEAFATKDAFATSAFLYRNQIIWFSLHRPLLNMSFQNLIHTPAREVVSLKQKVWRSNETWIRAQLSQSGKRWLMICGDEAIASSIMTNFPSKELIRDIGLATNKVPLVYIAPPPIEESNWHSVCQRGDCYPTVRVSIDGTELVDDFDTGSSITHVSSDLLDFDKDVDAIQTAYHLGERFDFFMRRATVGIQDDRNKKKRAAELSIAVVFDWRKSAFVKVNPDRSALIGRDILLAFKLRAMLNSRRRKTRIEIA
jgi:hypothetical protein